MTGTSRYAVAAVVVVGGLFLALAVAPAGVLRSASFVVVAAGLIGSVVLLVSGLWRGRPWGEPPLPEPDEVVPADALDPTAPAEHVGRETQPSAG